VLFQYRDNVAVVTVAARQVDTKQHSTVPVAYVSRVHRLLPLCKWPDSIDPDQRGEPAMGTMTFSHNNYVKEAPLLRQRSF